MSVKFPNKANHADVKTAASLWFYHRCLRRYAVKGNTVPIKIIVSGAGLAISFIIATHFFAGSHQLEIFALFLALTSCVYGGAALTPAGAGFSFVELPVVIAVFFTSIFGLLFSPIWLAGGYFLHGIWDTMHHFRKVETPIVKWFPPICAGFDILMAIFIIWLAYAAT